MSLNTSALLKEYFKGVKTLETLSKEYVIHKHDIINLVYTYNQRRGIL